MVNSPYGGKLVNRVELNRAQKFMEEVKEMKSIVPFIDFFYDSFKIADGSYSPLEGFMNEETLNSVLEDNLLPNGLPWTIPIIMTISDEDRAGLREGDSVVLKSRNEEPYAILAIDQFYELDKKKIAHNVYGTEDIKHPNVEDILTKYHRTAVSGKITVFNELNLPGGEYEYSPSQARSIFESMKWKNVVAYQARNPPHVAHEYLQKVSLELPEIDGLFIHLVIGRLKKGDYKAGAILETYDALIKNYHRREKVIMGSLSITMRYAGPKAALFLAIIRKNYGATHYIIGRDQAGVSNYYDPYAAHRIFDDYDIGIIPLKYTETFYCRKCNGITSDRVCPHGPDSRLNISQTKIREMLTNREEIPTEIMRREVADILSRGNVINTGED
jgi:sulfate adenylyltransferase